MSPLPLVLATLVHFATATAPSPCEELLACGHFAGQATQMEPDGTRSFIQEKFEISDLAPDTVRIVEWTRNERTQHERTTTWDLRFAADGRFTVRELGRDEVLAEGTCAARRCTFATLPRRALAGGAFDFDQNGFSYVISELAPGTRDLTSRVTRVWRRQEPPSQTR